MNASMKTISCFSYKGGAGRSTLALNVIPFLAKEFGASREHPLIVVDMDIDSCGITYLFKIKINPYFTVQYLFGEVNALPSSPPGTPIGEHDLFSGLVGVGDFFGLPDRRAILCLPAHPGKSMGQETNYDLKRNKVVPFIKVCKAWDCCGVLFDSAVGNQLTASFSNSNATHILCCLRPTKQFREGTKRFFDQFDEGSSGKKIIVVPNVVPTEPLDLADDDKVHHYPDYAKEDIINSFTDNMQRNRENAQNGGNEYILDLVNGETFGIPKIDRFMWQEDILNNVAKNTLSPLEQVALQQYEKIAALIKKY